MPVARIVTTIASHSPVIQQLAEQLRAAGYDVAVGQSGERADLLIEIGELNIGEALATATRLAQQYDADVYISPGSFGEAEIAASQPIAEPAPVAPERQREQGIGRAPNFDVEMERDGVLSSTLEQLGAAVAEGRSGIRETISAMTSRASAAWEEFTRQRSETSFKRQVERERRAMEREELRRRHEAELQRRAEENERLLAERERLLAEQARVMREQMAQEAAARAERERLEREAMAREAAAWAERDRLDREAEAAWHAEISREEEEQRRLAMLAAEHVPSPRNEVSQPAAALEAPPTPVDRERPSLADADAAPILVAAGAAGAAVRGPRAVVIRSRRRVPSPRERQWQHAAFIASIATLAAMLGFAVAANVNPGSPLPQSLMQNKVQQQVPFGPAKLEASSAAKTAAIRSSAPAASAPVRPQATATRALQKPSAQAKPHRRRGSAANDDIAEDEVVVRHAPTSHAQRAQSTGIRRYSDEN